MSTLKTIFTPYIILVIFLMHYVMNIHFLSDHGCNLLFDMDPLCILFCGYDYAFNILHGSIMYLI
jgi:hypothetical protein